ncbi:MAG: hypothetical protein QOE55_8073, partial [Acidobacteriaceae bacterium]|nr:hypothetical protein [Acidobacteriaceae bacterium]
CDLKHILAGNKAYLCRARMTRWWQSAGELREFHVDRDGTSLAECLGLLAATDDLAQTDRRTLADFPLLIAVEYASLWLEVIDCRVSAEFGSNASVK